MDIGYWFMLCSILGGSSGVLVGGFISDAVVQKLGTDIHINIYINTKEVVELVLLVLHFINCQLNKINVNS